MRTFIGGIKMTTKIQGQMVLQGESRRIVSSSPS